MIENASLVDEHKDKWEQKIQKPIDKKRFYCTFKNIKCITLCSKLRSFQYRLLNNAILTNYRLYRMKEVPSENCIFCGTHVETVVHILWECQVAQHIWQNLKDWLHERNKINVIFSLENIVFNNVIKNPVDCVNTITLIAKQYIYSSRCLKELPNVHVLKQKITNIYNIEKYIAISMGKIEKHNDKWKRFI